MWESRGGVIGSEVLESRRSPIEEISRISKATSKAMN
jgi:hypothetical protein